MGNNLAEKQIKQIQADFEKVVNVSGDLITFKKFLKSSVADPLYGGERNKKNLQYTDVSIKSIVKWNPKTWVQDDVGKRIMIDAQFIIAAKTLEDLKMSPVDSQDRIEYRGKDFVITRIDQGDLPLGKTVTYSLLCNFGPGI